MKIFINKVLIFTAAMLLYANVFCKLYNVPVYNRAGEGYVIELTLDGITKMIPNGGKGDFNIDDVRRGQHVAKWTVITPGPDAMATYISQPLKDLKELVVFSGGRYDYQWWAPGFPQVIKNSMATKMEKHVPAPPTMPEPKPVPVPIGKPMPISSKEEIRVATTNGYLGCKDRSIVKIWDISDYNKPVCISEFKPGDESEYLVASVEFSPFYKNIIAVGLYELGGRTEFWDISEQKNPKCLSILKGKPVEVRHLGPDMRYISQPSYGCFSLVDKNIFFTRNGEGEIEVLDISNFRAPKSIGSIFEYFRSNAVSPNPFDSNIFAVNGEKGITIYDISNCKNKNTSGSKEFVKLCSIKGLQQVNFSPFDKNRMITGLYQDRWNSPTHKGFVAAGIYDILDIKNPKKIVNLELEDDGNGGISSIEYNPFDKNIISMVSYDISSNGKIILWDISDINKLKHMVIAINSNAGKNEASTHMIQGVFFINKNTIIVSLATGSPRIFDVSDFNNPKYLTSVKFGDTDRLKDVAKKIVVTGINK